MTLIIYEPVEVGAHAFVKFWAARYGGYDETFYQDNIGKELTSDRILEWYEWKNGMRLADLKRKTVMTNFVNRRPELDELSLEVGARPFLEKFNSGGAIWRIFWLHCWQPARFPIYDQHVHRAMHFIQTGAKEEISTRDSEKITSYIDQYLPFYSRFNGINHREVDKALWAYGKFLSENDFPTDPSGTLVPKT